MENNETSWMSSGVSERESDSLDWNNNTVIR